MQVSFYSEKELTTLGLKNYGTNVLISKKASFYGIENISIGNNVRIDDFCILSGNIILGNYIHISAYTGIWAGDSLVSMGDYSGVSSHCSIYAISDDYSGNYLCNAMCPPQTRNVMAQPIKISKYVQIAAGSTILPGVTINDGAVVGAMSLVKEDLREWNIYAGIPCRLIKDRSKDCIR